MNQCRKVLFLADGLSAGGAERQLALLARYLPPEWDRRVWSLGNGPFAEIIRFGGIPVQVRERAFRYDISPIRDLWSTVLGWRPSLVHSWGWVCSAAIAPLCRLLNIAWIDGSIRIGWAPKAHARRARFAFGLANRVIANSQVGLNAWGIPGSKGRVVYNGFDPHRLSLTEGTSHSAGPFTAVMTGRMSSAKDFTSFIRAARRVSEEGNQGSWRFLALGVGPQRRTLIDSAVDLIAKGLMAFPDAGLEVLPYLRDASVGVLMTNPYLQEGCSNSILEYMACGLPVICSDSGGNREVVIEGKTGFFVPPSDADALAERLMDLYQAPGTASDMGKTGKQRLLSEFNLETMIRKTVAVYDELL